VTVKPHGMDFSDDQRYPAVIEVCLGNGYRYKTGATDEQAKRIIKLLSDELLAEEQRDYEREHGVGRFAT
jgi:hypothetical protein